MAGGLRAGPQCPALRIVGAYPNTQKVRLGVDELTNM